MKTFIAFVFLVCSGLSAFAAGEVSPLVSTSWLKKNLSTAGLVVLDVRTPKQYAIGHVPGAVNAPYGKGWRKKINGVVGMLPPEDEIVAHIRSFGIGNDSHVVVVPNGDTSTDFGTATRVYWTFKVLGHDKISILDGGQMAWRRDGGENSKEAVAVNAGDFSANFRPELLATEDEVKEISGSQTALVDARPLKQFQGKAKSKVVKKAGTIPSAVNLQQSTLYDAKNASFVSKERLAELSSKAGIGEEESTVTFCNTGHWASIAWFALSEIKGKKNVSMYDGSMAEWTTNPANPLKTN